MMNEQPTTIPKNPKRKLAEDFYGLRREGVHFIEQMGSQLWTDYNTHDPGITILDALCYALTDLAYRTGWDIEDLLASATPKATSQDPYPGQPFFTASEILTVNPWTPDDFRRLLIDLDMVRNAWVFCRQDACNAAYYAWCEKDVLQLSYQEPANPPQPPVEVKPCGLYDVRLELEADPTLGDLNDRKIVSVLELPGDSEKRHPITMEVRFPEWSLATKAEWQRFLRQGDKFTVEVLSFGITKTDNLLAAPDLDDEDPDRDNTDQDLKDKARDAYLREHWRKIFYLTFKVTFLSTTPPADGDNEAPDDKDTVTLTHAALRLLGSSAARNMVTFEDIVGRLQDDTASGFIQPYREKVREVRKAVDAAKACLHKHRNLDEDFCRITGVNIEDVAVCADVEVAADADIERVQAQIWLEIEHYFNPAVPFYTLPELQESNIPVEEIFNGPQLQNGFIKAKELEAAQLQTELRTSDIINRLMAKPIDGLLAVNNLLLSKYDAEGNIVGGAADPRWHNGEPVYAAEKTSASWLLTISDLHQPRLYYNQSCFLFYKNGLPFTPRFDEAHDTLTQLRGAAERPKIQGTPTDLPFPAGQLRDLETYVPLQTTFPTTYGIGADGLPARASDLRQAQAKQLKAYLLVFDQLLGNAFAQVAKTASFFSLDPAIKQTYFVQELSESLIQGYDDLVNALDANTLAAMAETEPEFLERRNRFLDHILARFGEQFSEYALLLTTQHGQQVARERLIADKIAVLNDYPQISRQRGTAFNYREVPDVPDNKTGQKNIASLKQRVALLLGYPHLTFVWQEPQPVAAQQYTVAYQLQDAKLQNSDADPWFVGEITITAGNAESVKLQARRYLLTQMSRLDAYEVPEEESPYHLQLQDRHNTLLGQSPKHFATQDDALRARDELVSWSCHARAIIVEHLLLRPKFPGDALYPACADGPCIPCGEEDPYSFRLTFVLPGWPPPLKENLELRRFAERTIRQEAPAHLLSKICWVGNDGFGRIIDLCAPVTAKLADLLATEDIIAGGAQPTPKEAIDCAAAIYAAFNVAFQDWYEDKTLQHFHPDTLQTMLEKELDDQIDRTKITCAALLDEAIWSDVMSIMVDYFHQIVLAGWQFERFEDAWHSWLEKNAEIDWTEECLHERVRAMLASHVEAEPTAGSDPTVTLDTCAADILTAYGTAFYRWMGDNVRAGNPFDELTDFTPDPVELCPDYTFKAETVDSVAALLSECYGRYTEVSYSLWILVERLSELRSIYPPATLHDYDDGNDENPVRLGQTVLGN